MINSIIDPQAKHHMKAYKINVIHMPFINKQNIIKRSQFSYQNQYKWHEEMLILKDDTGYNGKHRTPSEEVSEIQT